MRRIDTIGTKPQYKCKVEDRNMTEPHIAGIARHPQGNPPGHRPVTQGLNMQGWVLGV